MRRTTGAIFQVTVPATIIRSACRGEARNTSDPNRAMSYREEAEAIISIAQQARPNIAGHIECARDQFRSPSTEVTRMFLRTSSSIAAASSAPRMPGCGRAMSPPGCCPWRIAPLAGSLLKIGMLVKALPPLRACLDATAGHVGAATERLADSAPQAENDPPRGRVVLCRAD